MILDEDKITKIKRLLKTRPKGLTISDISQVLKINRNSVAKYLEILLITGQVEMRAYGNAKVYYLSQRVPFSAMLRFASELILVVDSELKITDINDHFLSFFHAERGDLIGMDVRDLSFAPLPDPSFRLILSEAYDKGEVIREINLQQDGRDQIFRVKIIPTVFDDGTRGLTVIMEDISREKQYEQVLRMNEARYRGIVEDQTEMIDRFLPDGTITFANETLAQYCGGKPSELVGQKILSFIHEEDREMVTSNIFAATRENPIVTVEHRVVLPAGEVRWNQWTNRALFDEEGNIIEYQGVGRDITDKKLGERELIIKDSVIASSINGIGIADLKGNITYVNRAFLDMFGYEDEKEVLNQPLEFFARGNPDSLAFITEIRRALSEDGVWIGETLRKRRDGSVFDAQMTANVVTDRNGRPICLMASFLDITERKRVERDLKIKDNAIASAINAIAIFGADGCLMYANKAFRKMHGYSDGDDILGKPLDYFAHGEQENLELMQSVAKTLETEGSWVRDARIISLDGNRVYAQISASLVRDEQGIPICTMFSIVDNTSQKRIEEALRTTYDKLQDAIEFMPDPTFIVDRDNRVIAWNRALETLTGMKKESILGKADYKNAFRFYEGYRPVLVDLINMPAQELARAYPQVRRFGDDIFVEAFIPGLNAGKGALIWGKATPLLDQDGNRIGAIESIRDISEWKRAEESLRESRGMSVAYQEQRIKELEEINAALRAELSTLKSAQQRGGSV
jgi:PAS domain S-box-containing protein